MILCTHQVKNMIPLKKNFTYLILNKFGQVNSEPAPEVSCPESGAYFLDTRLLNRYEWNFAGFDLLKSECEGSHKITQYFSKFSHHKQTLLIVRCLTVRENGFVDELMIRNDDIESHEFTPALHLNSDFLDMFEVRGHFADEQSRECKKHLSDKEYQAVYNDSQGVKSSVQLAFDGFAPDSVLPVAPRNVKRISIEATFNSDLPIGRESLQVPTNWLDKEHNPYEIYRQAAQDLHDLLLATPQGVTIAAGIPWFVTPFGRDSIIASWLLLKSYPELASGTLRFLAANQGRKRDDFRDELPGKILHEQRYGELSRKGELPFLTYYGSADATPLFVVLLHDYCQEVNDYALMHELQEHWQAALTWLETYQNNDGLIVFKGNANGLTVQSWKDSHDSLSYSDGRLGEGALAVAEVQGYGYAAYLAAAQFYRHMGEAELAEHYKNKALQLQQTFEQMFWMPAHSNYAIAVDEQGKQLDVNSSDSGHLLWSGIVPETKTDTLVNRLFEADMWSGWGLRTLGSNEVRYNPLSYHNGSIWPHDTAIFAAGLKRHGKDHHFETVKQALMAVAESQEDKRLPELFSGYAKGSQPILPYIEACRPQAWAAAALIYIMNNP